MVYTIVGTLESVLERLEKTLGSSRMLISEERIDDMDIAAAPHRVSHLPNPSRSLVAIVLLHYKRCTARKRATATHSHTPHKCTAHSVRDVLRARGVRDSCVAAFGATRPRRRRRFPRAPVPALMQPVRLTIFRSADDCLITGRMSPVPAAKNGGKWYRGVVKWAECFITR